MTISDTLYGIISELENTREAIETRGGELPRGSALAEYAPAIYNTPTSDFPYDWPDLTEGLQSNSVKGLARIVDDSFENWVSLSATAVGGYTIDWGDGSSDTVASNTSVSHQYDYSNGTIVECSEGYKIAVVTVSAINPITSLDLIRLPSVWSNYQGRSTIWLDLAIDLPSGTYVGIGQNRMIVSHRYLRRATIKSLSPTSVTSMFSYCVNLISVEGNINLTKITSTSTMFMNCSSLKAIPASLSLNGITNTTNMFTFCMALSNLPNAFNYATITNSSSMFSYCTSLKNIPGEINLTSATITNDMFSYCTLMSEAPNINVKTSISFRNCALGTLELNKLFTTLPQANSGAIIIITGCPGASTCNTSIAQAKGWTVTA